MRSKAPMEGHVIPSSLRFKQIKGFVQTFKDAMSNSHSINISNFSNLLSEK